MANLLLIWNESRRGTVGDVRVTRLEARCDVLEAADLRRYADPDEYEGAAHVEIVEVAVLDDGAAVVLSETGWSSMPQGISLEEYWDWLTVESVTREVLTAVLPDDDNDPDPHPYDELAVVLVESGLDVTADELRAVPYEVRLSDRLRERLDRS